MTSKKLKLPLACVAVVLLAGWWIASAIGAGRNQPTPPEFVLYAKEPVAAVEGSIRPGNWNGPAAITVIGNRLYVLDTGNDRILELDDNGKVSAVLCERGECAFLLNGAQSVTARNGQLYVANSGAGQVVVLSPGGSVVETIDVSIPNQDPSAKLSPAGIAVAGNGDIYVADTLRNLVLRWSSADRAWSIAIGAWAQSAKYRANRPLGLAVDARDNLYVAESGDGSIRMYSPEGRHLQEFVMRSNPTFFSPAFVAVDPLGDVYFTDNRSRMIFVYGPAGDLVGNVGLLDARHVDSPGVLRDPQGIHWAENILYVADRTAGIFGFRIDPAYWRTRAATPSWSHP